MALGYQSECDARDRSRRVRRNARAGPRGLQSRLRTMDAAHGRVAFFECDGDRERQRLPLYRRRQRLGPHCRERAGGAMSSGAMRALLPIIFLARLAWGDAGVLLPGDKKEPDPAWLSLEEMTDRKSTRLNSSHLV